MCVGLYVPAAQYAQGPPIGPVAPALQVQIKLAAAESESMGQFLHIVESLAARVSEYLPDPQSVQRTEPVAVLYVPGGHAAQDPPLAPVKPAIHLQAVALVLPVAETEFSKHV